MKDDPTFQFGENLRTQEDWIKAGPTDMFRLNAEIHAALKGGIAGIALEGGGVMIYWRNEKTQVMQANYYPDSKVINPIEETCDCRDPECKLFHHNRRD